MNQDNKQKIIRGLIIIFGILFLVNLVTAINKSNKPTGITQTDYSAFISQVKQQKVKSITIVEKKTGPRELKVVPKDGLPFILNAPQDNKLVDELLANKVEITTVEEEKPGFLETFFFTWGPTLFFLFVLVWIMKKTSGGGKGLFGFNKSKAQLIDPANIKVTFKDVVGCEEAKAEAQEFVEFLKNPDKFSKLGGRTPRGVLLTGPAGTGKAQPLYSNIRIPNGWKKMSEIKLGDLVCNPDGDYSEVTGIFPQGLKDNFKITFSDGSISESCDEHIWSVRFSDLHKDYRNYTLSEIQKKMEKGYSPRLYPIKKIDSPELKLPVDPYLLGVLLGDGAITTTHNVVSISTSDLEIINSVKKSIGEDYNLVQKNKYDYTITMKNKINKYLCRLGVFQNKLTQNLWDIGLCGKYSHEKFVPQIYLHSSYDQRIALLQGLMDTDGTIEKTNFTYYSTTSKELADDVVEIARSLGMISYINSSKLKEYTYKGAKHIANHTCYNVTIKCYDPSILFRLSRKKEIAQNRQYSPTKSIVKIEKNGQTEMQCIMLNSQNHLYVTDGYNTTHNTLLAKALAKESGVPFFSTSGSEFVEMFVGVGAGRVRDMFETAKKVAPCVLFIDEIDAIGGKRGSSGMSGGHDEREQTLNQILVELDGMDTNKGIILVGATNRPEVLDPALLRPGRIDRQIVVGLPDVKGRVEILKIHSKEVPLSNNVDLNKIARGTPGFSGAELANIVNEASIFAARKSKKFVDHIDFEQAKDKIMMGVERPSLAMSVEDKRKTAYHEAGHAVIAKLLPKADPVHKVTIIPRGRALGVTMQLPEQDRWSYEKDYLMDRITILMGGRAAEEVFCNIATNGASNDIAVATSTAKSMVREWGMSSLGPIAYGDKQSGGYLGGGYTNTSDLSPNTMQKIDDEVFNMVNGEYLRAKQMLENNKDIVESMTAALMEVETIDDWQIENLMQRRHFNDQAGFVLMQEKHDAKDKLEKEKEEKSKPVVVVAPPDILGTV